MQLNCAHCYMNFTYDFIQVFLTVSVCFIRKITIKNRGFILFPKQKGYGL